MTTLIILTIIIRVPEIIIIITKTKKRIMTKFKQTRRNIFLTTKILTIRGRKISTMKKYLKNIYQKKEKKKKNIYHEMKMIRRISRKKKT